MVPIAQRNIFYDTTSNSIQMHKQQITHQAGNYFYYHFDLCFKNDFKKKKKNLDDYDQEKES